MDVYLQRIFPEQIVRRLREINCTTANTVLAISDEKFRRFDFTQSEVQHIRNVVSKAVIPKDQPLTNAECLASGKWKRITSGCSAIDKILSSGISNVGITEICGEAGTGKSQLCLQFALTVQLPEHLGGFGRGAVYISTEGSVPVSRTVDIAQYLKKKHGSAVDHINFSDNILIKEVLTETELLDCVNHSLPTLMTRTQIGLIIIDSIGAPFRIASNYLTRAKQLRELYQALLKLSEEHRCAVICVNQVTSVIDNKRSALPEDQIVPCLGLLWANLVSTRLQIYHGNRTIISNVQSSSPPVRKIRVLFAPDLRQDYAEFTITSDGVEDFDMCSK